MNRFNISSSAAICPLFAALVLIVITATPLQGEVAKSVSQYGITWTFDKPCTVGKFVNGDWWVVGPVTVVSVTPAPGPAPADEPITDGKSRYGASALIDDKRLRNGSMIILDPDPAAPGTGFADQGYDSRCRNYKPECSVGFPCQLKVSRTLISTISGENYQPDRKGNIALATPFVFYALPSKLGGLEWLPSCAPGSDKPRSTLATCLETAAVLTCLDKAPPADAFRPPYAGTAKPIYQTKSIRWDLLPKLKPIPSTPDFALMERYFQRPWLDHVDSWLIQYSMPGQNGPNYGKDWAILTSMASLMLMLDVPREKKEKLMIELIQLGIDLHGLADIGRQWFPDGGHWSGRKWPILFASLMLDKPDLRSFPPANITKKIYGVKVEPSQEMPHPTTFFQEDVQTYYGKGALGQRALWQIGVHSQARAPFEEKPVVEWNDTDKFCNNYRPNQTTMAWIGTALAVQLMKAKAVWGHDAFFDYADRWMRPEEVYYSWDKSSAYTSIPVASCTFVGGVTRCQFGFTEQMWHAYRKDVPQQPGAPHNYKWVWTDLQKAVGQWVNNNPE